MTQRLNRTLAALIFGLAAVWPQTGLANGRLVPVNFNDYSLNLHLRQADRVQATGPTAVSTGQITAAPCSALTASSPASWFATDSDGNVDTTTIVDSYPTSSTVVAPGFTYDCVPKDTEVVIIIYNQAYGTDPALVEKRTLQASPSQGLFFYALTTPDGSPLQEGKWRVAFYQGKTPLSTGEILLGGSADVDIAKQAVLQGAVVDARSGQPVVGARLFVLNPGVTVADFARDTVREDIFVQTRTDDQGQFAMWKPLERNTQYAMLIAADGYKLRGTDRLIIGDQADSPVNLEIKLAPK
jgi:hypothetical protein